MFDIGREVLLMWLLCGLFVENVMIFWCWKLEEIVQLESFEMNEKRESERLRMSLMI